MARVALESGELTPLENQRLVKGFYPSGYVGLRVSRESTSPAGLRLERIFEFSQNLSVFAFQIGEEACSEWKGGGLTTQDFVKFEAAAGTFLVEDQLYLSRIDLTFRED